MPRRGSRLAPLTTALAVVLLCSLSACGDDGSATDESSSTAPSSTPTAGGSSPTGSSTPEDTSLTIDVTRDGDAFTPNGERVDAETGQPITLAITADEPGELHVHSVPEQEIAYAAGTSEHEITIDRPGVVEVESHDPDLIVLQLEVR